MNAGLDAWLTGLGPDLGTALVLCAAFVVGLAIGIERGISTSAVGIRTCCARWRAGSTNTGHRASLKTMCWTARPR